MKRAALLLGIALFIALVAWQGGGSVVSTLAVAGWGLLPVAMFHLAPLALDAAAIDVLMKPRADRRSRMFRISRMALLARWSGESVNSLMPAGQLGGPALMIRHLSHQGMQMSDAAAAITVSTTLQTAAQLVFAVIGVMVFAACQAHASSVISTVHAAYIDGMASAGARDLRMPLTVIFFVCATLLYGFYAVQRRGLFGRLMRVVAKAGARRPGNWSTWLTHADGIDIAIHALYSKRSKLAWSFSLSLAGWVIGTGEVWLGLKLVGHPLGWVEALLLESLGQAIRGAAFMIPGSLGVQEAGYLLLAPLVGLPPEAALALSLVKRAREALLGLPGLAYLPGSERRWRRRPPGPAPGVDGRTE